MDHRGLVVCAGLLFASGSAVADPTAADVLAGVDKAYGAAKTAQVRFKQTTVDPTFGTRSINPGSGWIARPDQLRWQYRNKKNKVNKVLISDGVDVTIVDKLNKQVIQQPIGKDQTPAALKFLTGKGRLAKEFTPTLTATDDAYTLELVPTTVSAATAKLTLVVDPKTYLVRESIVEDTAGRTTTLIFDETKLGVTIKPSTFKVNLKDKSLRDYRLVKN